MRIQPWREPWEHKAVAEYIAKQETRRAKKDFGEEYATLLRLHAVEYDVQYFLD